MPKIVDHHERRQSVIEATWRVIAREGIANATTREIAKEADCSSGILAHYFKDKADIMASALLAAHDEVHQRIDTTLTGLAALRQYMIECLPLDERRRFLAVVEASFWGQAAGNQRLIDVHSEELEGLRERLRERLKQAADAGELRAGADVEAIVLECHVLIDGLSIQSALYPHAADADQQTDMLDAIIARIRA